ncbi:Homeobox domain-containing protein [Heracleum sosnowskyi]|uniref:Homeobox domain-containing protein n=1 Tax=Heracleum sosnowskyi TaxID=360622 RepID=A0AAD8J7Q4_9APIA|nr:Homeobox domain-containing protein [Heracleum sosnowskyi]
MEMNNNIIRGEPHVAQHRRRDKLRAPHQNSYDRSLEQSWLHQVHIPDLEQLRSFKYGTTSYDQTVFTSEMLNYVTRSSQGLLKQNDSFSNSMIGSYLSHPNSSSNLNVLPHNYTGNLNSIFVGGETNDVCAPSLYPRQPNCYSSYQDVVHFSIGESSMIHQNSLTHIGELQQQCDNTMSAPFDYQNTLQQVVPDGELEMAQYSAKDSNELVHFLPSFVDSNSLSNTPVDQSFRQWNIEGQLANKSQDPQGLSLSLSVDFRNSDDLRDNRYSKALKYSNYLCSSSKQSSAGNKGFGFEYGRRNIYNVAGPHGPFTGYASILKDSKYLKPALELLEELCGSKQKACDIYPHNLDEDEDFSGSSVSESSWPSYHKNMANLLYLQQEVCRKYKQYQQQMQMVVSSFESVEGVSTATPYISMALKTMSVHFRCLKDAISDQLKHTGKELGEELSSPAAGTSSSTKFGGDARNFHQPKQPVWKPQRGLPERAVSVLRAWLFDHFLHPYPTDTDKHMLAIQTGLTRNQVSNWFINARVRIWKPMVEEIHLLETKGLAEESSHMTTNKGRENMASGCASHQYDYNHPANRLSGIDAFTNNEGRREDFWNQEKRTRTECHIPVSIEGSLMSFLPYQQQQDGFEFGAGHGNVSLTLGLRQNAASVQQQMHQQEQHGQHF